MGNHETVFVLREGAFDLEQDRNENEESEAAFGFNLSRSTFYAHCLIRFHEERSF